MSTPGRRAWRAADVRDFDVGVELADGEQRLTTVVEPAAVRRVAALGGRIAFTVYRAERSRPRVQAWTPPARPKASRRAQEAHPTAE